MVIEEKYLNLLGKFVYNKNIDKIGRISYIQIAYGVEGYYFNFNVYYDSFNHDSLLFVEDFKKDKIKFVIFTDECLKEGTQKTLQEIKEFFGRDFSQDMILTMSTEEKRIKDIENDNKNTQMLNTDLVDLTSISVDVLFKDFYSRELYLKYKNGVLNKEELLYALINYISQEFKKINDSNRNYFVKYELPSLSI